MVKKDIKDNYHLVNLLKGRLKSAYSLYNDRYYDPKADTDLQWSKHFPLCHPPFSIWRHYFSGWIDFIYYTPQTMRPLRLLDMPDVEGNLIYGESHDLPSAAFPSDHFRIAAEFEVYYN